MFILAGGVFKGGPARYNLPLPRHHFVNDQTVRIGENQPDSNLILDSIELI